MNEKQIIAKEIGARLRHYRQKIGLSGEDLARKLGINQSQLSRIEAGLRRPTARLIVTASKELTVPAKQRDELVRATKSLFVDMHDWKVLHRNGLARYQIDAQSIEKSSKRIRVLQTSLIPGLLQTPEYATSVLHMVQAKKNDDIKEAVLQRLERQTLLYDQSRAFTFLLTESALRSSVCPNKNFPEQLKKLRDVSRFPNVVLGVIPSSVRLPVLIPNSFHIFDRREVRLETTAAEIIISDLESVRIYDRQFEALLKIAKTGESFRRWIS
jgi:transcriptional regulator with XRE-family HTH domain